MTTFRDYFCNQIFLKLNMNSFLTYYYRTFHISLIRTLYNSAFTQLIIKLSVCYFSLFHAKIDMPMVLN